MKLLIYIPKITSRNRYAVKTVCKTYLSFQEFEIIDNLDEFVNYSGPKFSYSAQPNVTGVHFAASGLLEQRGIKEENPNLGEYNGVITLFATNQKAALPFDPFAAIFYMLTRYEEYLPHLRDNYDRFTAKESLAKKENFLHLAVVERWVDEVKKAILRVYTDIIFPKRKYSFISTIDIDNAFAFKEKGLLRVSGSILKSLLNLNFEKLSIQMKVLFNLQKDPFDTYNYQLNLQKQYKLKQIYFILIGDYGLNDKNLPPENRRFQSLIKTIADYAEIGIHPSFGSNSKKERLENEIERLSRITKREIKKSRQHFLKLKLPDTYRDLIERDVEQDYTMGFANELGFRAGTCTPYPFYDIDSEVECKLTIYPFQVMEATLKYYLKLGPEDAIKAIEPIIEEIKTVDGLFISLWHNESLSEFGEWNGWRKVFEEMIKLATSKNEQDD